MKNLIKLIVKKVLTIFLVHFPIKINSYWFYMSPNNVELVPVMIKGKYEIGMTKLIKRVVKRNSVICDVGAYIGYHTTLFSKLSDPQGKIFSFEPQPYHYKLLLKNIKLNKLENVSPLKTAISNRTGFGKVYMPDANSPDSRIYRVERERERESTSKIKLGTLDDLLKNEKRVDLIKVDVQGWEERVIIGARKTILRNPKLVLIIEFWPKGLNEAGTDPLKFLSYIRNMGFNIYSINEFDGNLEKVFDFPKLIKDTDGGIGGFVDLMCSKRHIGPNFKN